MLVLLLYVISASHAGAAKAEKNTCASSKLAKKMGKEDSGFFH